VRYASLPTGGTVVVVEAQGDGSEVKTLSGSCDSAAAIPVAGGGRR
jgi:hypothetical protein